jgi:hypothetical protein
MKGDFTRFTFDPKKRYTNVFKQQGRVDLDADWNEQSAIDTYLDRISRMDLSGVESGAPSLNPGFLVSVPAGGGDLNISAGRFYAQGNICELFQATTYLTQPYPPSSPPPFTPVPAGGRTDSVYLDVWQRHITAIEDPSIKEIALSGPDTTTRLQTIFQIRINENVGAIDCSGATLPAPSDAVMTSSLVPVPPEDDLCLIGATGGYRGLENRLYRVEIDMPGPVGTATFKWSRDNGSVVFPIFEFVSGQPTKMVRVTRLGRDQVLSLHEGDWVEVLDDGNELAGTPGTVAQIQHIDTANRELTLSVAVSGLMTAHPKVRRWDQKSAPIATSTAAIPLEDGIQVSFGGANLKTGDYWTFWARATDGTIETLTAEPAQGIKHVYARLAIVTWTSPTTATVQDCRNIFPTAGDHNNCCCCTVTVGEGGDFASIQEAIDKTPVQTLLIICLRPGVFKLSEPIRIGRDNLVIVGCNERTLISAPDEQPVLIAGLVTRIAIESISLQGGGDWAIWSQATRFRVRDCDFINGGIWIAEGSAQVEIVNNRMTGGRGPGVAFRRSPPGLKPPDIRDINGATISGNSFTNFGDGAIVCGFDPPGNEPPTGIVLDLKISNNLINKCAEAGARTPYIFPAVKAAAGIALMFARRLSITENTIADSGISRNPACGVSLVACSAADVSRNTIVSNGVRAGADNNASIQAGVFAFDTSNPTEGLAAYRIEDNTVITPAGQSLLIISGGDMMVANNRLNSNDLFKQPESLNKNPFSGISLLLTNLSESTEGRLLFHGNQIFSHISAQVPEVDFPQENFPNADLTRVTTRCLFSSKDDTSISDNQFLSRDGNDVLMHILAGVSFIGKEVKARTTRVVENRVFDFKDRFAIFSASLSSILTSNQTRGIIESIATGTQRVVTNNITGV